MNYIGIHSNHLELLSPLFQVLGIYKGVEARHSSSSQQHFLLNQGFFTGNSYDDLEYIRRFSQQVKKVNFYNIFSVKSLWSLSLVERIEDCALLKVSRIENTSSSLPLLDDYLFWRSSEDNWHVGVVSQISPSFIRVANQSSSTWSGHYSTEFSLNDHDPDRVQKPDCLVLGWLRVTETQEQAPEGMRRISFNASHLDGMFNLDDPFELAFSKDPFNFGEYREVLQYYAWSKHYFSKILTASSELHAMILLATDKVVNSDELLTRFGIDPKFWPHLRRSWNSHEMFLSGRFDLASDGKQVKLLEYNADSAGIICESSIVQGLWARTTGCSVGRGGGDEIHARLVQAWRKIAGDRKVHIFVDHTEDEEIYMEKYYGRVLQDAGVQFKDNNKLAEVSVTETAVLDKDGEKVDIVWKVWNWNTVIKSFLSSEAQGRHLSDIMFHPSVTVVEPFWKLIPSNKALLPVLWELFPDHPYLLRTSFSLTEELAGGKYVSKPISGRLGENVSIHEADHVVEGKEGHYSASPNIYQEFFSLPLFDDAVHAILGGWVIGEAGSGIIVREHESLITGYYSPIICCRVVDSE